ncbi:VCBS repeat-containing protein, partial [bacterium]|nr:VCBS repeat-containing protein [bacterium]
SPQSVAIADLDGDGKPDLAIANTNFASVLRNTSTGGAITSASFAAQVNFSTGGSPRSVAIGDVDGDGKPDLAIGDNTTNKVSVFRNIATSGSFTTASLAAKADFSTGGNASLAMGDLDGDGKPEIAVANNNFNTVSVLRNTATSGSIT